MTSLVFGNFYFDHYIIGLVRARIRVRVKFRVRFFRVYYEVYARTERALSLFLFFWSSLQRWRIPHFEVLRLGLKGQVLGVEASKFSKMPCPQPRIALFFDLLKMGLGHDLCSLSEISRKICDFMREEPLFCFCFRRTPEILRKICNFCKKNCFVGEHLRFVSLASSIPVLGLKRVGPRPRIFLCP